MSSAPDLSQARRPTINDKVLVFIVQATILWLCGPLCLALGAYLYKRGREQGSAALWALYAVLGAWSIVLGIVLWDRLQEAAAHSVSDALEALQARSRASVGIIASSLLRLWIIMTPVAPAGAVGGHMLGKMRRLIGEQTAAEALAEHQQFQAKLEQLESQKAARDSLEVPSLPQAAIGLGSYFPSRTTAFPKSLGVHKIKGWLGLDEAVLDTHIGLFGATGEGKSVTLKRLIYEVLTSTDRNLIFVDGNGDEDLAQEVRALCFKYGRGNAPIFRLGHDEDELPSAMYNAFVGDKRAIRSRLEQMLDLDQKTGPAAHYKQADLNLLELICYAPGGPPRSFSDALARLDVGWLKKAYNGHAADMASIRNFEEKEKSEHYLGSLRMELEAIEREFRGVVDPAGYTLEDTPAIIFSLRAQSVRGVSSLVLKLLVEDIKDAIGKRLKNDTYLVIDEFGALDSRNMPSLLSIARKFKVGITLATQDTSTLGDEKTKQQILASLRTKLLMATDYPEELAKLAGTVWQLETSMKYDQDGTGEEGTIRPQHTWAVDPNEVAKLDPGEGFLIRKRHTAKLKIAPIDEVQMATMRAALPPEEYPRAASVSPVTQEVPEVPRKRKGTSRAPGSKKVRQ